MDKAKLKIKLINQGYQYIPSRYLSNGTVVLSFSLPAPTMKKLKNLINIYGNKSELFRNMLFNIRTKSPSIPNKKFYGRCVKKYCQSNNLKLKKYKHGDYKFSSVILELDDFEKIDNIARGYGISRSAVVRLMIESMAESLMK